MTSENKSIDKNIDILNKLYDNRKYFDSYGGSAVISVSFVIASFVLISYLHLKRKFDDIKKEWPKYRCHPQVIPFAGIINKDPDMSILETSASNFTYCTNTILTNITGYFVSPIYYLANSLTSIVYGTADTIQYVRMKIASIISNFSNMDSIIMGKIMGYIIPVRIFLIKIKNMMARSNGTLVTSVFTAIGGYLGLKSFLGAFLILMGIAYIVAMAIAAALSTPFTWVASIPFYIIAAFIAFVIGFVGIVHFMVKQKT